LIVILLIQFKKIVSTIPNVKIIFGQIDLIENIAGFINGECNICVDFCYDKVFLKKIYDTNFWPTRILVNIIDGNLPAISIDYPTNINFFTLGLFEKYTAHQYFNATIRAHPYLDAVIYLHIKNNSEEKNILEIAQLEPSIIISHIEKNIYVKELCIIESSISAIINAIYDNNLCIDKLVLSRVTFDSECYHTAHKLSNINKIIINSINNLDQPFNQFVIALYNNIDNVPQVSLVFGKNVSIDKSITKFIMALQNNKKTDKRLKKTKGIAQ
jgi:hypothetical protein